MATKEQLETGFATLSADLSTQLTAITTEVHLLKGKITSQNNSINAADLDPLLGKINDLDAVVKTFNPDAADAAPVEPAAPTETPTPTSDGGATVGTSSVPS